MHPPMFVLKVAARGITQVLCLIFAGAMGCGSGDDIEMGERLPIVLRFDAQLGDQTFECGQSYTVGSPGVTAEISDMRLYVSNVALIDSEGREHAVTLDEDGRWQSNAVALLDFENGTGSCVNGTSETNRFVRGHVEGLHSPDALPYEGLKFSLGVPFEQNHQDVALAQAPLSISSMWWNWQGGYKFLRIDGRVQSGAGFRFHLGSTGCELKGESTTDVERCAQPNRADIYLDGAISWSEQAYARDVVFDVDRIFSGVDMSADSDGQSRVCMSSPDHAVCQPFFKALGMEFGASMHSENTQIVFR